MIFIFVRDRLWGDKAKLSYLLIAAIILLFSFLGSREIWTQEHRWADIVSGMFYRHDFLHPYLGQNNYYDKPLLSYWFIAFLSFLNGQLSLWALRLPSALSGLLCVGSIYFLGSQLKNKSLGFLSGWMLITTFYFVFWSRTSSADMLNLGGSLFAVAWYIAKRNQPSFFNYSIFFLILSLTCLCKGLIGAVVPLIAVFLDLILRRAFREHFRTSLILALFPALFFYMLPFWASTYFGEGLYGENGLYLVYKENILRYFFPFDHRGSVFTYFIYLPIYLLPWTLFLFPALWSLPKRWKSLSSDSKWMTWVLFGLFIFFSMSGSRRSYYVLPIVPFAILFMADWILSANRPFFSRFNVLRNSRIVPVCILSFFFLLFFILDLFPAWYYAQFGLQRFAKQLQTEVAKIKPWDKWHIVLLDAETKLNFYLKLPPDIKNYSIKGDRVKQKAEVLAENWAILLNQPRNTIFISRKLYAAQLKKFFSSYRVVELSKKNEFVFHHDQDDPVAFVPIDSAVPSTHPQI